MIPVSFILPSHDETSWNNVCTLPLIHIIAVGEFYRLATDVRS